MKEECIKILENLLNKKHILFSDRGNIAIMLALKLVKNLGKNVLIPDQAGWYTYRDYSKKVRIEVSEIDTDYGLIKTKKLEKHSDCGLLANSMPGYFVFDDMEKISEICKSNNITLINDTSGSIGTKQAKYGDISLGSFRKHKTIELGHWGFIATNDKKYFDFFKQNNELKLKMGYNKLYEKLNQLDKKIKTLKDLCKKVKEDLKEFEIIHRDKEGFNVIVRYRNEKEKGNIIKYIKQNNYEYRLCPLYIRVNSEAVSIELKRLVK